MLFRSKAEKSAREAAGALRRARDRAALQLGKAGAKAIARLGFKKADFQVRITTLAALGPHGDCGVEFLFSPNVGEAPMPLQRIASSGELARVMLGLKAVLAEIDDVPLLVFDEVDANVGGEIGRTVGENMAEIGERHQVLCVTHLPQVAAQANAQWSVAKGGGRDVLSQVTVLDSKARIEEIARMLGGVEITATTRRHAAEMLGIR